jgi:hypothetical protein
MEVFLWSLEARPHATVSSVAIMLRYLIIILLVYYRVYAQDGPIPSMHPVYSNDPYLARILAEVVAPPHTAKSVKRCISNIENIEPEITTDLFLSVSNQAPMDDASHVSIIANPGPGCLPSEPMALVANVFYTDSLNSEQRRQAPTSPIVLPRLMQPLTSRSRGDRSFLETRYRKS